MAHLFAKVQQETYPIQIDITDPIDFASSESSLMDRLRAQYAGKCLRSILVQSVDAIRQRGFLLVSQSDPTLYYVQSLVTVTGISITAGAILTHCRITNKQPPRTVMCECTSPSALIIIMSDNLYSGLPVGSIIPVRVVSATYPQGNTLINIYAKLFTHQIRRRTYPLSTLPIGMTPAITAALSQLAEEERRCQSHRNTKNWGYFLRLFSPNQVETGVAVSAPVLLPGYIAEGAMGGGLVAPAGNAVMPLCDGSQSLAILHSNHPGTDFEAALTPAESVVAMIAEIESHLRLVRSACEIYNTPELVRSHTGLWNLIKSSRPQ